MAHAANCQCVPCVRKAGFDEGYRAGRDNELKRVADLQQSLAIARAENERLLNELDVLTSE